jgi:RNA polymerase sigma-70 factor, ECF subfamily
VSVPDPQGAETPPPGLNAVGGGAYDPATMGFEATRLMLAVKAGDPQAFDQLVVALRGRAFQVARALVGSREDALDLSQETFLKVFRARETFREGEAFLPWFHRILRNTCFSFLRSRGRLRRISLSGDPDGGGDWELADPSVPPSAGLEAEERAGAFHVALAQLTARDREILVLRHFEELSYRELALALDVPEGTVMSRLFHARRRLREKLIGAGLRDELEGAAARPVAAEDPA